MKRISRLAVLTIATSLTVSGVTVATAEEAQTPPVAVEQAAEVTKRTREIRPPVTITVLPVPKTKTTMRM